MRRTAIIIIVALVLVIGGIWSVYKGYLRVAAEAEEQFKMHQVAEARDIGHEAELVMGHIMDKMMRGQTGTDTYISGWHRGEKGKIEKLMAYAPFSLGDGHYSVALATPRAGAIPGSRKNFVNALGGLTIVTLIILVGILSVLRINRRRSELLKGKTKLLEEIRESEERYRNLFKNSLDGVFTVDNEGNITSCNRVIEEMLGYTTGELMALNYRDYMDPETADYVFQRYNELFRTGRPIRGLCYEIVRKDGKKRIVEGYVSLIKKGGWIEGFQGSLRDITEQKKMEEALLESERRHKALFEEARETKDFLETIFETSPDMVTTTDKKGFITFTNRAAAEILGYKKEELLGKHVSEFYDRGMERAREINDLLIRDGELRHYRFKSTNREGREIWVSLSGALLKDSEGKAIGTLGFFRDITPLVTAEEELRTSEKRYRDLLQNSSDLIYTVDIEGRFTSFNKAGEEVTGFAEKDILGKHVSIIVPQDAIEKAEAEIRKLLKGEKSERFEINIRKFGKGSLIGELSLSLIWEGGRVIGTMGIIRDITEKRRAEEEIRKKNEELENFVHSVSHDLKAPVVSIQGFSSILLTNYLDKLDDNGKRYLTRIQSNATKMQMIIADLLEFSRIGMVVSNFENVSPRQIITDVLTMLAPQLKGLKVNVEGELPTIRGDRNRIYQVFENLIQNSIKYMGGTEGPMIRIGCEPRGEFYEFYVRDNGIGIDPKYHQKIFQIFQRLNDVAVEGTGIGLATVKKIVETYGGAIRIESEKGKGATFYFTMPRAA
ncbi:MAG: PAS domain S-box protein [Syntrophales bacterium]|nr:PAS domain S-box protein [Syntrophales bacterium]